MDSCSTSTGLTPPASVLLPEQDRESCATFLFIIKGAGSNPTCYHSSTDSSSHAADDVKGIHHELSAEGARYGHGDTETTKRQIIDQAA